MNPQLCPSNRHVMSYIGVFLFVAHSFFAHGLMKVIPSLHLKSLKVLRMQICDKGLKARVPRISNAANSIFRTKITLHSSSPLYPQKRVVFGSRFLHIPH